MRVHNRICVRDTRACVRARARVFPTLSRTAPLNKFIVQLNTQAQIGAMREEKDLRQQRLSEAEREETQLMAAVLAGVP